MKSLGLGTVEEFPFIDPPASKAIQDGYALLAELGAVDEANELTEIGKHLARLPVDPRVGRMVLAAKSENALREVLIIAAGLSVQDPRQRPSERAAAADEAQKRFDDEKSDFLSWIKLWNFFEETLAHRKSSHKRHEARCVATVEPEWLEAIGAHLVKRHQYAPHWEKQPARVAAFERGTLYGLPLYAKRRVHYGPMDPVESRKIFVRHALVEGDYDTRAPFFLHNRRLVQEIEQLEHKSRRPDVLVDDELICAFYESLVPKGIHNGADFDRWRREAESANPKVLFLKREDLMRHEAAGITIVQFPHRLEMAGRSFALDYHHEPGSPRDGVTLTVPLVALNQVDAMRCDWLVPGLAREKVTRLAKSLPQKLRHQLGPLQEFVDAFLRGSEHDDAPPAESIARYARRELNLAVPLDAFRPETLPAHLSMNFRIVDEHGRQLATGRNLAQLRAELGQRAGEQFARLARSDAPAVKVAAWDFGDLEEVMEIRRGSQTLIGYPGLVDHGDSVSLEVFDSADKARETHRSGLRRLFMLQLKEQA